MHQDRIIPAAILDYAQPPALKRRWWVFAVLISTLLGFEILFPRLTPDVSHNDAFEVLLTLVGALVLALATSVPGWAIGLYGGLGACVLLRGVLEDNNVRRSFSGPGEVNEFITRWVFIILMAWAICRAMVLLRRLRRGG